MFTQTNKKSISILYKVILPTNIIIPLHFFNYPYFLFTKSTILYWTLTMWHALFLTQNYNNLFLKLKYTSRGNGFATTKDFQKNGSQKDKTLTFFNMVFHWNKFLTFKGDCSEGDTQIIRVMNNKTILLPLLVVRNVPLTYWGLFSMFY